MKTLVGVFILILPWTVLAGKDETNALLYLSKYGYINKNDGTGTSTEKINDSISALIIRSSCNGG